MSAPKDGTNRAVIDQADPNVHADQMKQIALGSLLQGQIPQVIRKGKPVANANNLATMQGIALPASGKASVVLRAYARAGTVTGALTPVVGDPATTQIGVGANGDILTLAADAITDLDVVFVPERADVIEVTLPVAANVLTIPAAIVSKGVVLLADVNALAGTATGRKIVLAPGAGAPAAGQARLNVAKSTVTFAAADAVTSAKVTLAITAAEDLKKILEAAATTL